MIRLGITGGIGSGKSYVSSLLKERGIPVYDTDRQAKLLTVSHPSIRRGLTALLGDGVYFPDGRLNKSLLASFLFDGSDEHVCKVNSIIHPCVRDDFQRWAVSMENEGHPLVGMESAILFESGFDKIVDKVLMVYAPESLRVRRAMERDNSTEEQVRARMTAQMDDEEKRRRSDFTIVNDEVSALDVQIDRLLLSLVDRKCLQ